MLKIRVIIFSLFITTVCYSQVVDDFSDGDFSSSPAWAGNTSQFIVNTSLQLQLNNTVAAKSYLSTSFVVPSIDNFEWQGYVKQSFAPSGTNFGRVYLVSDQQDLTQPLNGYYLQFGEALSNDAVELFRQSGTTSTSVCRGTNASIAASFALRFKVTRDNIGVWSLLVDHVGGNNFVQEATGTDASFTSSNYFGVLCTYTVSNATKFYYDDFIARPLAAPDISPPTIISIQVPASNSLSVLFSETLDAASAQAVSNYSANNNIGSPSSAVLQSDGKTVLLTFNSPFTNGVQNQLSVSSVKDLAGNMMANSSLPFLFYQPDITPPTVSNVAVTSANSLSVLFSELIDASSSQNVSNYSVNNNLGNPATAILQADGKTVFLNFGSSFVNGLQHSLNISSVKDTAKNIMTSTAFPFLFFQPNPVQKKDLIFTELFADPSPQVGLPNAEFVEIYNRSSNAIDLKNWIFSDGVSKATFTSQIILPNEYWIVTSSANAKLFSGNVIGVSNFPTLNNDGDHLTLKINNQTIDSVNYSLDWYHDTDKQDGGWTLELIDPNNTCSEGENWTSSEDASGGTPGKQNSVFANKPDLTGPMLKTVVALSDSVLQLSFDEKLEKDLSSVSIILEPSVSVSKKYFADPVLLTIEVALQQKLQVRTPYTVTVSNLTDCAGNFVQTQFNKLTFALSETSDSLDVVINEILFNPKSGGVDFVEIYNRSPKFINLKNWNLANNSGGQLTNPKIISATDFILAPSSYIAFTSDPSIVLSQYPQAIPIKLFKTSLPSMPDDEGSIVIASDQTKMIDSFSYSEKFHSPFIKDSEGVSLERVSFTEPTNESSNWKSASATVGFATPGYVNSNSRPESLINENAVSLEPEIFSPSVPGMDFTKINYRFDQSGKVANIKVLDAQGRLIKTVANNETLAFEGFYRWDGERDDGTHARLGYYVVWFEIFDNSGSVQIFRKRAVIGK
jgi:hypothetical protein